MRNSKKKKWTPTKEELERYKQNVENVKEMSKKSVDDIFENYTTDVDKIIDYLRFSARFYKYSPNNTALIYKQMPHATFVQSSAAWKKMGAYPNKGTHGAKILVPKPKTYILVDKDDFLMYQNISNEYKKTIMMQDAKTVMVGFMEADEILKQRARDGEYEIKQIMNYGIGTVFDIGQTTFPKEQYPLMLQTGQEDIKYNFLCNAIASYIENKTVFKLSIEDVESISLRGFFLPVENSIVISDKLCDTERLKTMLHELGRAFYHGIGNTEEKNTYQKEIEADIFATMFLSMFGMGLNDSLKMHLKDNYEYFINDLRDNGVTSNDEIKEKIESVTQNIMKDFNEYAKDINEYIEEFVHEDMQLQKESIDQEQQLEEI